MVDKNFNRITILTVDTHATSPPPVDDNLPAASVSCCRLANSTWADLETGAAPQCHASCGNKGKWLFESYESGAFILTPCADNVTNSSFLNL